MTTTRLGELIRNVHGRLADGASATDAALLERFFSQRDEAALAALVRRHGPMVYGVCQRLLRDPNDAEDVFQAAFLVLVRKGPAVRQLRSVANWLYGVARRTALEARRSAARRRAQEAGVMRRATTEPVACDDLREILDEELARLPDKFRAPLVLCDLEGRTRKEAARQLGWPDGTVASRLAAARKLLAGRLARRGLALSGGVLVADEFASGAVPAALVNTTVRVATGRALAAPAVTTLVKGVLVSMLAKNLKTGIVALLVAAAIGTGGFLSTGPGPVARAADAKPPSELESLRHENELLKLNLQVVLEKVRAQEGELAAFREKAKHEVLLAPNQDLHVRLFQQAAPQAATTAQAAPVVGSFEGLSVQPLSPQPGNVSTEPNTPAKAGVAGIFISPLEGTNRPATVQSPGPVTASPLAGVTQYRLAVQDPLPQAEAAVKALRSTQDDAVRQKALQELESALKVLKATQHKPAAQPK